MATVETTQQRGRRSSAIIAAGDEGRGAGEFYKRLGKAVRLARLARGVSQESLAEAIGVTFQQVQKYEKGVNRITVGRLAQIGVALDEPNPWGAFVGNMQPNAKRIYEGGGSLITNTQEIADAIAALNARDLDRFAHELVQALGEHKRKRAAFIAAINAHYFECAGAGGA